MANRTIFDWPDIDAVAWMSFAPGDAHVDFACFEVAAFARGDDGEYIIKEFGKKGEDGEFTPDMDLAQPLFHGTIKWDGCSHVYFGEADNAGYIHMCGVNCWKRLPLTLERIFAAAAERLKRGHNDEFFEA